VAYNVHIVQHGGTHWVANLTVRDFLRAHPGIAAEYAAAKRTAAAETSWLLAYSDHKARFVGDLVRRALTWASKVEPSVAPESRID